MDISLGETSRDEMLSKIMGSRLRKSEANPVGFEKKEDLRLGKEEASSS
jgi:hypothetical protein